MNPTKFLLPFTVFSMIVAGAVAIVGGGPRPVMAGVEVDESAEAASAASAAPRPVDLPAPIAIAGGVMYRDVRYGDAKGWGNMLDLYVPSPAPTNRPTPLLVWIHGGGWDAGAKAPCNLQSALKYGYAVASINYRWSREAPFPAQIHDCKGAIRWLRANAKPFNIDGNRIGVWGESAGGHLAALLGTTAGVKELEGNVGGNAGVSSAAQAVVDWFGPTDIHKLVEQLKDSGLPEELTREPTLITKLLGGPITEKAELARTASPLTHVDPSDAPFLILHGDRDPLVPLPQSKAFEEALRKAKVESRLIVIKNTGHGGAAFGTPENRKTILAFFDKHLKG